MGPIMSAVTIHQMAQRVADMMEQRLGVSGKDLGAKLRRGKRQLPRKVALAAQELSDASERAKNPKLLVQIDQAKVAASYDICVRHLSQVKPGGRAKGLLISVAATVALGLLILGVGIIVVLRMRGHV